MFTNSPLYSLMWVIFIFCLLTCLIFQYNGLDNNLENLTLCLLGIVVFKFMLLSA